MKIYFLSLLSLCCSLALGQKPLYDIVLKNGRVMDPETGLDAIRNVGITGNRIAEISTSDLAGKQVIDVSNLVVAPGFIDMHAHGQTNKENEYQMHDGVTTAMELESGRGDMQKWLESRKGKAILNYGASASHQWARTEVMSKSGNSTLDQVMNNQSNYAALKAEDLKPTLALLENELYAGAIGIGVPIAYYPGATREEVYNVYALAADKKMIIFTHVREGKAMAIQQAISDAVTNGAALHIVHLNSVTLDEIDLALRMVSNAQQRGLNVSTELYPYTAGSTFLQSALFDEGWQKVLGISYGDLQWVETGERLTESTFKTNREKGGIVIIHNMKPEWIDRGIAAPFTIVASDGMPYSKLAHPRSAGTFSRVLGQYVRERKVMSLMDGIRKITLMPALRLEPFVPSMRYKGRLQVGADADITVFDPATIIDKATFEAGLKFSEGIRHVLVNGTLVLKNGTTIGEVYPGQPVYGKFKR